MSQPLHTTLVFPMQDELVLLGMKKSGFGADWWNGFGGKNKPSESFLDCARRETKEEVGLEIKQLQPVARLLFYFEDELEIICAAYTSNKFSSEPGETREMRPEWFPKNALPFETMWPCDHDWIPQALEITADQPTLDLAIYFDAAKNYLDLKKADPSLISQYFEAA